MVVVVVVVVVGDAAGNSEFLVGLPLGRISLVWVLDVPVKLFVLLLCDVWGSERILCRETCSPLSNIRLK